MAVASVITSASAIVVIVVAWWRITIRLTRLEERTKNL
jgi:hypothetical protein